MPIFSLEKKIDECDGYIRVFPKKWGQVPKKDNAGNLSVTAIEFERAKKRNIPLLVFISSYEKDAES
jgi:hypothetical protein